ncbi:NAD(P)/FAD-dependent oxidoreductase [Streptacidiphilus sp. PB12-B1b]|uniref:NAD(P)/FAD-dependent oxidoreductase n=1 Tax=Streptacidiphilus sp. PB12-B1b TaxID=2705012 RepID=UPI001CDD5A74|nr:NAD(P)/FAD-dependent oxidoreductase [Streptacidiphilus sp. PB12-B1b]
MLDAVVVGAGPAGLSAALSLGRMRRRCLLADPPVEAGRTPAGRRMHGYPTRDGVLVEDFRSLALGELSGYPGIEVRGSGVGAVAPLDDGFQVTLADRSTVRSRRLLLATGLLDRLPPLVGVEAVWGRGVFSCPYCHAWELRGLPLAVLGGAVGSVRLAVHLRRFSDDVVLLTEGSTDASEEAEDLLSRFRIRVDPAEVTRVAPAPGGGVEVRLRGACPLLLGGLFVPQWSVQGSALPEALGCAISAQGRVRVNQFGHTSVAGVYAAGDMAKMAGAEHVARSVAGAVAAGAQAGFGIDQDLLLTEAAPAAPATAVRAEGAR